MGFNKIVTEKKTRRTASGPKPEAWGSVPSFKNGSLAFRVWLAPSLMEYLGVATGDMIDVAAGTNDKTSNDYGSVVVFAPKNKGEANIELKTIREGAPFGYFRLPLEHFPTIKTTAPRAAAQVTRMADHPNGRVVCITFPEEVIPRS